MKSFFITTTARDTPTYPWAHANYIRIQRAAQASTPRTYTLANHPKDADVILFVEPARQFQTDVTMAPLYKRYREKSMVLDFLDNPIPVVPGLYVGMTRQQEYQGLYQGGGYLRVADNSMFDQFEIDHVEPDLLFSFIGKAANYPIARNSILRLNHIRSIIRDQSSNQSENDIEFVRTIFRSKFVLAPRGVGPSSWRLFETMRAGRVPVVISNDWVPPGGVNWSSISVRVAEKDIPSIPLLLESLESRSEAMGKLARLEWERCFSYSGAFGWIADRLSEVAEAKAQANKLNLLFAWRKAAEFSKCSSFLREQLEVRLGK